MVDNTTLYHRFVILKALTESNRLQSYLQTEINRLDLMLIEPNAPDYDERWNNLTTVIARKWFKLTEVEQQQVADQFM